MARGRRGRSPAAARGPPTRAGHCCGLGPVLRGQLAVEVAVIRARLWRIGEEGEFYQLLDLLPESPRWPLLPGSSTEVSGMCLRASACLS